MREACASGARAWWVALPHQRPYVFRRVTAGGRAVLGLEVVGAQQAYYRLLSAVVPAELRPLVVGTARVVLVAEALRQALGRDPSPGEAKLFAAAIAEAKRHEVPPAALPGLGADAEVQRLSAVYAAYQDLLRGRWDYDDVRSEAARLVERAAFAEVMGSPRARAAAGLPDLVVADGWRELGPLDWRFLEGVARYVPVHVALPSAPPHRVPDEVLSPREEATRLERYHAVNVVDEARWVLRSLKRDLVDGFDPLDLAVVAPDGTGDALAALADEYGVPIADERGTSIADTPVGRALLGLVEFRSSPTPSRLLAVLELAPAASAAMRLGVTGADALERVASAVGLGEALARWSELLAVRGDPVEWTRWLLDEVLTLTHEVEPAFRERVLTAAQHAARLGGGERFQAWLAALLQDVRYPRAPEGGVALLTADLASGRRFERCYVMGAAVGSYGAGEREDYFVPDDARAPARGTGCLPRRFAGGDDLVVAELLTRGRVTVVTVPLAGPDGALVPDERLTGDPRALPALPALPAGSPLELGGGEPFEPSFDPVPGGWSPPQAPHGGHDVEWLRELVEGCALKAWGERELRLDGPTPGDPPEDEAERELRRLVHDLPASPAGEGWRELLADVKAQTRLDPTRLEDLARAHPWAAGWLRRHADTLTCLSWNAELRHERLGITVRVDAAMSRRLAGGGWMATLYRFTPPAPDADWDWARRAQADRWTEYLAAKVVMEGLPRPARHVAVHVWPVLGDPVAFENTNRDIVRDKLAAAEEGVGRALEVLAQGRFEPRPDERRCKRCRLKAVCRMGELP